MKGKKISILVLAALAGIALMVVHTGVLAPTHLIAADVHNETIPGKPAAHAERVEVKAKPDANGQHKGETERQDDAEDGQKDEKVVHLTDDDMKKFDIEVAIARPGKLKTHLSLSGEVSVNADRMAHIVPRMPGVVREVRKNLGDKVQQGELMAVIASRELADAKAEYLAAREKVTLAQAKFSREEGLWKKKISAEQEYLDAR
jgi:cobalt-zinc-cadmium efflux system membrane fusion protein